MFAENSSHLVLHSLYKVNKMFLNQGKRCERVILVSCNNKIDFNMKLCCKARFISPCACMMMDEPGGSRVPPVANEPKCS